MPIPVKTTQTTDAVLIAIEKAVRLRVIRSRERLILKDVIDRVEANQEIPISSVLLIREMAKRYDAAMDPALGDPNWVSCLSKAVTAVDEEYEE